VISVAGLTHSCPSSRVALPSTRVTTEEVLKALGLPSRITGEME
jgi:hypothetical protein